MVVLFESIVMKDVEEMGMKENGKRWLLRAILALAILAALFVTRSKTFVVDLEPAMEKERIRQGRHVNLDYSLKLFCRRAIVSAHIHCIGPGQTCPIHHHPKRWELTQVTKGVGRLRTATGTTDLLASDYYIAPPGAAHEVCNPGKETLWCLVVATPPFSENLYLDEESVRKDKHLFIGRPRLRGDLDEDVRLGESIVGRLRAGSQALTLGLDSSSNHVIGLHQRFISITSPKIKPFFAFIADGEEIPKELEAMIESKREKAVFLEIKVPTYWQWYAKTQ